jgi:hypothetical protein
MNTTNTNTAGMGLGIAGLILGILSIPFGVLGCTFLFALVLAILGITLSAVGYTQARQANAQTGLIVAAMIISIVGFGFAVIRMVNSLNQSQIFIEKAKDKLKTFEEHAEEYGDEIGDTYGDAFEEGFESEFGEDMETTLEQLEDELESVGDDIKKAGVHIEADIKDLTDEEKARKLGKAAGKALREFVDELNDSTDTN